MRTDSLARPVLLVFGCWSLLGAAAIAGPTAPHGITVVPEQVSLTGNFDRAQLVVRARAADGGVNERSADLTEQATYESSNPAVVAAAAGGRLLAAGDGEATITVRFEEHTLSVPVTVGGVLPQPAISWDLHVQPLLAKAGCNAGACHASQYGKGGFKLSVFGSEPAADWDMLMRDRQGRRVDRIRPENSLFLLKPTMTVPHGGGRRLTAGSTDWQILTAWVAGGAARPDANAPKVTELRLHPLRRVGVVGLRQQLQVQAVYSDGRVRDVTHWAKYDSMGDAVCRVTTGGVVETIGQGQGPVLVRFENNAQVATFVVPFSEQVELTGWDGEHFVDRLAADKFRELGIQPSPLCDDATFLRRAYLDAIGKLPTPEEARAFLASTDANKRRALVERLLGLTGDPAQDIYNDYYAALWTLRWSDLIRNSSRQLGDQGMWAMHNWIKESFRANKPFDRFVRELITAKGSIYSNGPANYFRVASNPPDQAEATAQLFLGVRLQCAKCHHHPFEKYSQADYYGFAAFFSRISNKNSQEFGLFGRESVVLVRNSGEVSHPRTGKVLPPTPLGGEPVDHPLDRRIALAEWLSSPDNKFFARNVVNRYMAYLLGAGLVEPVDDMRDTNPPSNAALMDALAEDFIRSGYNLKHLMRTIMTSRLYQLDSQPTDANRADRRFYSHFFVKRLQAEVLLDAIDDVCGTRTKFVSLPPGTRAIELPDGDYPDYFLRTFGKPRRESNCECERVRDENLAQAMHMLNGEMLGGKIGANGGRLKTMLAEKRPFREIVEEMYLAALSRSPREEEWAALEKLYRDLNESPEFYEDVFWALLNSKEFLFVK